MISDDQALDLHNRSTRGQALSTVEQAALEAWYAEQDRTELAALRSAQSTGSVSEAQRELEALLARLTSVSAQIQEIVAQNDAIRRDNAALRHQLTVRLTSSAA